MDGEYCGDITFSDLVSEQRLEEGDITSADINEIENEAQTHIIHIISFGVDSIADNRENMTKLEE